MKMLKRALTLDNLKSRTTAWAAGITIASIDHYTQFLPDEYKPIVHAIAVIALFLYTRKAK